MRHRPHVGPGLAREPAIIDRSVLGQIIGQSFLKPIRNRFFILLITDDVHEFVSEDLVEVIARHVRSDGNRHVLFQGIREHGGSETVQFLERRLIRIPADLNLADIPLEASLNLVDDVLDTRFREPIWRILASRARLISIEWEANALQGSSESAQPTRGFNNIFLETMGKIGSSFPDSDDSLRRDFLSDISSAIGIPVTSSAHNT